MARLALAYTLVAASSPAACAAACVPADVAAVMMFVRVDPVAAEAVAIALPTAVPAAAVMAGAAVAWGVRRAVFASANGLGEATFAAAAARTSHPAKQGLVQAFSVYIDTLFVCSATGFMLLITGLYNVQGPDGAATRCISPCRP